MGWFRRGNADDDFYRGDAPVLMPGVDGQAPTAYVSGSRPSGSPAPDGSWTTQPPPPASPNPDWATPTGQPGPGWAPPEGQFGPPPPVAYGGYAPAAPHAAPGSTERAVRRVGLGCFSVVTIIVLLSIAGVAFAVFSAVRTAIPGIGDSAPDTVIGTVDVPVTVRYDDTDVRITIGGAQSQPGAGWGAFSAEAKPAVVIAASIQSGAAATGRVTIPFIYWTFAPEDGSPEVTLNIISGFEPSIVTTSLAPGEAEVGYLAFETPATAGTLSLKGGYGEPPLATWKLTATPAVVITGGPGVPVQGQIGLPPFTVTLAASTWVDATSEVSRQPPATGSYLVADLTIASTGQTSSGIIDQEQFVFVTADGQSVLPVGPGVVQDTTSIGSVSGGSTTAFGVAFDVPVGPGTLEMRDEAGRPVLQWPVG